MLAARDNIHVSSAAHWLTLDLVGSYGKRIGHAALPNGNTSNNTQIGIELNVPLFAGGSLVSQTREAQYQFQVVSADLEKIYRNVLVCTRQHYNDVLTDISKLKADRQMQVSAQASFASTEASFKAGTRTILEVLNAPQRLYET